METQKNADNWVNPLSANSDQQQFSPNNIHTLSRDIVMRINKMITIEKMLCSFIKFSQLIVKGGVWRSVWRICMWILGPKGLSILQHLKDTQSRVFVEECLLRLLQCWKSRLTDVRPSDYCRILSHSHKAMENLFTESVSRCYKMKLGRQFKRSWFYHFTNNKNRKIVEIEKVNPI